MVSKARQKVRNSKGSALSEMGPALLLLLMFIFFPMLDVMGAAAAYGSTFYLNLQQSKEAAVVNYDDAMSPNGQVQKGVVDVWLNNGVGKFVKTTEYPKTKVSYRDSEQDAKTQIRYKVVTVTTTVKCLPFVKMPWFVPVPGMNAPMEFNITSEAQMENPDDATSSANNGS